MKEVKSVITVAAVVIAALVGVFILANILNDQTKPAPRTPQGTLSAAYKSEFYVDAVPNPVRLEVFDRCEDKETRKAYRSLRHDYEPEYKILLGCWKVERGRIHVRWWAYVFRYEVNLRSESSTSRLYPAKEEYFDIPDDMDFPLGSPPSEVYALIKTIDELYSKCRDGSGDDSETEKACNETRAVHNKIEESGWCQGPFNIPWHQQRWIPCSEDKQRPPANVTAMMRRSIDLNSQCRGGSGDDLSTEKACDERDALSEKIEKFGWCWGSRKEDPAMAELDWLPCFEDAYGQRLSRDFGRGNDQELSISSSALRAEKIASSCYHTEYLYKFLLEDGRCLTLEKTKPSWSKACSGGGNLALLQFPKEERVASGCWIRKDNKVIVKWEGMFDFESKEDLPPHTPLEVFELEFN